MSNYEPTFPGEQITTQWLLDELARIATSMAQPTSHMYEETFAAPDKPKEGLTLLADGTMWNPGAGRGLYIYLSGAWVKL